MLTVLKEFKDNLLHFITNQSNMPKVSNKINWETDAISFYKFVCQDEEITSCYVGHTANFRQRKNNHKSCCNNPNTTNYNLQLYQTIRENGGWGNWKMIEISNEICKSARDAERIEQIYINELKAGINMRRAFITEEQQEKYRTEYNKANATKILERQAEYNKANATHIAEYQAKYNKANATKIAEYQAKYNKANATKIAKNKAEYNKANATKIAEQKAEYYKANATQINKQKTEYRKANATKIAERNAEYRKANATKIAEQQRARYAQKKAEKEALNLMPN